MTFIIRLLDIVFSVLGLVIGAPLLLLILIIGFLDTGSPIFRQQRVGYHLQPFVLVKFRTMKKNTIHVASHLANRDAITPFGHFLRRSKLDELPQLWNVLKGDMSLVGPRPCLFTQRELIDERIKMGVFDIRPGITGLAQIKQIDMSTPILLAQTDKNMIREMTVKNYLCYILYTVLGQGAGDRVA